MNSDSARAILKKQVRSSSCSKLTGDLQNSTKHGVTVMGILVTCLGGPPHAPVFRAEADFIVYRLYGTGNSKAAAIDALTRICKEVQDAYSIINNIDAVKENDVRPTYLSGYPDDSYFVSDDPKSFKGGVGSETFSRVREMAEDQKTAFVEEQKAIQAAANRLDVAKIKKFLEDQMVEKTKALSDDVQRLTKELEVESALVQKLAEERDLICSKFENLSATHQRLKTVVSGSWGEKEMEATIRNLSPDQFKLAWKLLLKYGPRNDKPSLITFYLHGNFDPIKKTKKVEIFSDFSKKEFLSVLEKAFSSENFSFDVNSHYLMVGRKVLEINESNVWSTDLTGDPLITNNCQVEIQGKVVGGVKPKKQITKEILDKLAEECNVRRKKDVGTSKKQQAEHTRKKTEMALVKREAECVQRPSTQALVRAAAYRQVVKEAKARPKLVVKEKPKCQSEEKTKIVPIAGESRTAQAIKRAALGERKMWNHPLIVHLLLNMALPGQIEAVNFPAQFSDPPSCPVMLQKQLVADWGQSTEEVDDLSNSECVAFAFRGCCRAFIVYQQNTALAAYTYNCYITGGGGGAATTTPSYILGEGGRKDIEVVWASPASGSTYNPHGSILFTGRYLGSAASWLWLNESETVVIAGTSTVSFSTGELKLYADYYGAVGFVSQKIDITINVTGTSWSGTYKGANTGNPTGYYSFYLINETGTDNLAINVNYFNINGSGDVWCHLCAPGFDQEYLSTKGVRINGVALQYKNTSSSLNNSGSLAQMQSGTGENFMTWINETSVVATISAKLGEDTRELKKGCYQFMKPSNLSDFDYVNEIAIDQNNNLLYSGFLINDPRPFLITAVNCVDPDGTAGRWLLYQTQQYRTNSMYRTLTKSIATQQEVNEAMEHLSNMNQYYDNVNHFSQIMNAAKTVAQKIVEYGPGALSVLKMML